MGPPQVSFWKPIFEQGRRYFDITNINSLWRFAESGRTEVAKVELIAPEFKKLLSQYGIDKPIWVTEAMHYVGNDVSPEEQGRILVRSCVISFSCGVDKFFYGAFRPLPSCPPDRKQAALVRENGEKRPAYYALKALISKLDRCTFARKLAEGQYRFMVAGEAIYVLWGSGEIPEEIAGEVSVTDIYGNATMTDSTAIKLTENPIFAQEHPH